MKFVRKNANTVLYVSGMFAGDWMWQPALKKLNHTNNILMLESLSESANSVHALTQNIKDELTKLSEKVSIAGNSLGSLVALNVAKECPNLIDRVMISGSAGFGEVDLGVSLPRHAKNVPPFVDNLLGMLLTDKNIISEIDRSHMERVFSENLKNVMRLIKESNTLNAKEILDGVKCPIYAIWGANDNITPLSSALPLLNEYNAEVTTIRNCGHSPMYECPEEFCNWFNDCMTAVA